MGRVIWSRTWSERDYETCSGSVNKSVKMNENGCGTFVFPLEAYSKRARFKSVINRRHCLRIASGTPSSSWARGTRVSPSPESSTHMERAVHTWY